MNTMWRSVHNLIAHPILALSRDAPWAVRFHDATSRAVKGVTVGVAALCEVVTALLAPPLVGAEPGQNRVIVGLDNDPYLTRWYLLDRGTWRLCLHYFHRGDEDRELHNHPWRWAVSWILSGGYKEERLSGIDVEHHSYKPGALNLILSSTFHRVTLLDPKAGCWSLILSGPIVGSWGFLTSTLDQFINHKDFRAWKTVWPYGKADRSDLSLYRCRRRGSDYFVVASNVTEAAAILSEALDPVRDLDLTVDDCDVSWAEMEIVAADQKILMGQDPGGSGAWWCPVRLDCEVLTAVEFAAHLGKGEVVSLGFPVRVSRASEPKNQDMSTPKKKAHVFTDVEASERRSTIGGRYA